MVTRTKLITVFQYILYASTFIYGAGFALVKLFHYDIKSSLYASLLGTHSNLPIIWGTGIAAAAVLAAVQTFTNKKLFINELGHTLAIIGWLYASIVYFQTGYILVGITVGLHYLVLWCLSYFLNKYEA